MWRANDDDTHVVAPPARATGRDRAGYLIAAGFVRARDGIEDAAGPLTDGIREGVNALRPERERIPSIVDQGDRLRRITRRDQIRPGHKHIAFADCLAMQESQHRRIGPGAGNRVRVNTSPAGSEREIVASGESKSGPRRQAR